MGFCNHSSITYSCNLEASFTGSSHSELCLNNGNFPLTATHVKRSFICTKLHFTEVSIMVPLVGSALSRNGRLPTGSQRHSIFGAHTPLVLHHPAVALFPFIELLFPFIVIVVTSFTLIFSIHYGLERCCSFLRFLFFYL